MLFTVKLLEAAPNDLEFPKFTIAPKELSHVAHDGMFALWSFTSMPPTGPWEFFDAAGRSFVICPANQFSVADLQQVSGGLRVGINSKVESLPSGLELRSSLTVGAGINDTFESWGRFIRALHRKQPSPDDPIVNRLGYWTDNGANYYYRYEEKLGYTGTLEAVKREFDAMGLQLGYIQLDSWFYPKGAEAKWSNFTGGLYEYRADRELFSNGLRAFRERVGIPLATHSRWVDRASPYRRQYRMSGNVVLDPLFWSEAARYLADSGVLTYEQDWLGNNAQPDPNLNDSPTFFEAMADAMREYGISIQYCMATPRHFLESARHSNVTNIRVSEDRFGQDRWNDFLYGSRLASALGLAPFSDVFMSSETENLVLATLSAGPVGVGDRLGQFDAGNLHRAARSDGLLVKPDKAAIPIDRMFQLDARFLWEPMIAATFSEHAAARTSYVVTYPRLDRRRDVTVSLAELGTEGPAYVYNYFGQNGSLVESGGSFGQRLERKLDYWIVAPLVNGIALLGDLGHFASMGRQRVATVRASRGLIVDVDFARGEGQRVLHGYSGTRPSVTAIEGSATLGQYDGESGIFGVAVDPGPVGRTRFEIVAGR